MRIGSLEHRDLICREFINGFTSYHAGSLSWPELDAATATRLRTIPFWSNLLRAEQRSAQRARQIAGNEDDHSMREALALFAYEKTRAASVIECMMRRYGIKPGRLPGERGHKGEWGFILGGIAETYDAIFAFGLFRLAIASCLMPPALVAIFDRMITEQARQVLFFYNWIILRTRYAPLPQLPLLIAQRCSAFTICTLRTAGTSARIAMNRRSSERSHNFVEWATTGLNGKVSLRSLIQIGLKEFAQRMEAFDPRLPRPNLSAKLLRITLPLLKPADEAREKTPSPIPARDRSHLYSQSAEPQASDPNMRVPPLNQPHREWAMMLRRQSRMPVRQNT